jgi:hypothetical protein
MSGIHLVKSARTVEEKGKSFHTGEVIPCSGIYEVAHTSHRLLKQVTLLKDQTFPTCSRCTEPVTFTLVRYAPSPQDFNIVLYSLPEQRDDEAAPGEQACA